MGVICCSLIYPWTEDPCMQVEGEGRGFAEFYCVPHNDLEEEQPGRVHQLWKLFVILCSLHQCFRILFILMRIRIRHKIKQIPICFSQFFSVILITMFFFGKFMSLLFICIEQKSDFLKKKLYFYIFGLFLFATTIFFAIRNLIHVS